MGKDSKAEVKYLNLHTIAEFCNVLYKRHKKTFSKGEITVIDEYLTIGEILLW